MSKAESSSSRISLKELSPQTFEIIRELKSSTSEDIATILINRFMGSDPKLKGQETIRRRIYDVINVLSAAKLIDKVGKQIIWNGNYPYTVNVRQEQAMGVVEREAHAEDEDAIRMKEKTLSEKIRLLTLYKILIKRNFHKTPSPNAIFLPAIIIGVKDSNQTELKQPFNHSELEIRSKMPLLFLSPSDILQRIRFTQTEIMSFLKLSPELYHYGAKLLVDDENSE